MAQDDKGLLQTPKYAETNIGIVRTLYNPKESAYTQYNADPDVTMLRSTATALRGLNRFPSGPYVGIVLRVGHPFADGRQSYKVWIPEIHTTKPTPLRYASWKTPKDPIHWIIDMHTTFVSKAIDVQQAVEGQYVWVDYGNIENLSDPIYIGPVEHKQPPTDTPPKNAMKTFLEFRYEGTGRNCYIIGDEKTTRLPPTDAKDYVWTKHKPLADPGILKQHIDQDAKDFHAHFSSEAGDHVIKYELGKVYPSLGGGGPAYQLREWRVSHPEAVSVFDQGITYTDRHKHSNDPTIESVHKGAAHYKGEAIDIATRNGNKANAAETIKEKNKIVDPVGDIMAQWWEDRGYRVVWRTGSHWDHLHVSWGNEAFTPSRGYRKKRDKDADRVEVTRRTSKQDQTCKKYKNINDPCSSENKPSYADIYTATMTKFPNGDSQYRAWLRKIPRSARGRTMCEVLNGPHWKKRPYPNK